MEPWITVVVAAIVALSTLGATWLQNRHSNQRFKIELGRAIDVETKKRKWGVRSKPLLKLREELAVVAVKYERLVAAAHPLQTKTEEAAKKELQEYLDDINVHIQTGSFDNIRYMLSDEEIINRIDEIIKDYRNSYFDMVNYKYSNAEDMRKAFNIFEINKARIIQAQELINKRLEGL